MPRQLRPDRWALWAFDVPFASRISPERDRVTAHAREWVQRMGLRTDEEALHRHDRMDPALWPCMCYPDATGPDLDLLADWPSWWAIWDDLLDGPFAHDGERVRAFFDALTAVVAPTSGAAASADPFVAAFTDIWRRQCEGMSPGYRARAAAHWVEYFEAFVTQNVNRRRRTVLSVDEYLEIRDVSGAVWLLLDFAERAGHYEVPERVLNSRAMQLMRLITVRVINITQDVQSLAKEEAIGDQHNLVLVLEREASIIREEAIGRIHVMMREATDAFLAEEARLPRVLDELGIPPEDRGPAYRHAADMRAQMRGDVDFCAVSDRYT